MKKTKRLITIILALSILLSVLAGITVSALELDEDVVIEDSSPEEELMPMGARGCSYTSVNQMKMMVNRGQAPNGVVDVHGAHTSIGKPHVHFTVGALNIDGTIHDGVAPTLTNAQRNWLITNGWGVN